MKSNSLFQAGLISNTLDKSKGENLPHWSSKTAIYHIAFRLHDSIPVSKREELILERFEMEEKLNLIDRDLTENEMKEIQYLYSEKVESFLDSGFGNCYLGNPEIAELVSKALQFYEGAKYHLHAWCIMPNHVHVIFEVLSEEQAGNLHSMSKILHSWKSYTASQANRILNRSGNFWQKDYYNHIIRSEKEYRFQIEYVWENSDKANLKNFVWRWKRPE